MGTFYLSSFDQVMVRYLLKSIIFYDMILCHVFSEESKI